MRREWLAALALFATAAAWGATFTLIKNVLASIAVEPFIFWRFTTAGVVLVAFAFFRRRLSRALLVPAAILGLLVFLGYWCQTKGLLLISPSRSAFLTGLYVVMVPFADRAAYGTRVSRRAWAASVLAVIGTTVLIGGFDARPTWGDLLTVVCAAMFALHVVFSARWSTRHATTGLAAIQVLVVGLLAAPFAPFATQPTRWSPALVLVILFTALVTTALAFAALMWGQAHVSATEAAVILSFEPVAASITSIVWDGEPITTAFVSGALLILVAMVLSQLPEPGSAAAKPPPSDSKAVAAPPHS